VEFFLGKWTGMTQKTGAEPAVENDCPAAVRIAAGPGQ
jgi:hypothetical protein